MNNLDCDGKSVLQVEQPNSGNAVERLTKEHILDMSPFLWENGLTKRDKRDMGTSQ